MKDDEYREYVKYHLRRLTPAGLSLLRLFAERPGQWLTRRQLAGLKHRSYLMRYDIKLLNQLVERGLIEHRRERIADAYGEDAPRFCRGSSIAAWSYYHRYRLLPGLERYLNPQPRQAAPRQAAKPIYIHRDSPLEWLREKLGLG